MLNILPYSHAKSEKAHYFNTIIIPFHLPLDHYLEILQIILMTSLIMYNDSCMRKYFWSWAFQPREILKIFLIKLLSLEVSQPRYSY